MGVRMLGEVFALRFVGHLHIITCPFIVPLSKLEESIGLASHDASFKGSSSPMHNAGELAAY